MAWVTRSIPQKNIPASRESDIVAMRTIRPLEIKVYSYLQDFFFGSLIRLHEKLNRGRALTKECPSLEALAGFVEHSLESEQRKLVEDHLADCRLCRKTVALTYKIKKNVPAPIIPKARHF
jgi:hypothetical protein